MFIKNYFNKYRRKYIISFILLTILFFMPLNNFMFHFSCPNNKLFFTDFSSLPQSKTIMNNQSKLILFYTKFFGSPWSWIEEFLKPNDTCGCNFTRCELSFDQKRFLQSDIVIFHARDMPCLPVLETIHVHRPKHQSWGYFVWEPPQYAPEVRYLDKYFNFSISYRTNSEVMIPYRHYFKLQNPDETPTLKTFAKGKTKHVVWFVSNCGQRRDRLVDKLSKYGVRIDVGGACAHKFKSQLICESKDCREELKEYKFYFAAENFFCKDYITEKYWWNSFENDLVPIVLGGSNYSNPQLAIPGSFIDAQSFKSVKDLADYILQLDGDNDKYQTYFEWKKINKLWSVENGKECRKFMCELCDYAHSSKRFHKTPLSLYIDREEECSEREKKFDEWILR